MALKLHIQRNIETRREGGLWQKHFLRFGSTLIFDKTTIFEIKRGLELGRLLKLPMDLAFNYDRMIELIVAGMRPLSHVE